MLRTRHLGYFVGNILLIILNGFWLLFFLGLNAANLHSYTALATQRPRIFIFGSIPSGVICNRTKWGIKKGKAWRKKEWRLS